MTRITFVSFFHNIHRVSIPVDKVLLFKLHLSPSCNWHGGKLNPPSPNYVETGPTKAYKVAFKQKMEICKFVLNVLLQRRLSHTIQSRPSNGMYSSKCSTPFDGKVK